MNRPFVTPQKDMLRLVQFTFILTPDVLVCRNPFGTHNQPRTAKTRCDCLPAIELLLENTVAASLSNLNSYLYS